MQLHETQISENPDVKFYWWFLATNYLHLVVYAIAAKNGDDYFYMEDHCMIRKVAQDSQNQNDNNMV